MPAGNSLTSSTSIKITTRNSVHRISYCHRRQQTEFSREVKSTLALIDGAVQVCTGRAEAVAVPGVAN